VFGILAAQLLLTACVAAPIVGHAGVRAFVTRSGWVTGLAMAASLVLLLVLTLSERARHSHPTNLALLAAFTAAEGVLVGAVSSQYNLQAVILAVALTAGITVGLCAYAMQTQRDFTLQGGLLLAALLGLLLTGVLGALTRSAALQLLLAGGGAVLFACYLVYDVQLIAGSMAGSGGGSGGRQATAAALSPDDYVVGAIMVYLDAVNLFLHLLRLVSEMNKQ
jgi:FtsH-binding integral membrane protein